MKSHLKTDADPVAGRRRCLAAAFTLVILMGPALGTAEADWYVRPSITQSFTYDDNIRLRTTDKQSAWGLITSPRLRLERSTPTTDLAIAGALDYGVYPDESRLDYFNQRLDASADVRSPRHRLGLGAVVENATTLTTEDEDTGLDFTDRRRVTVSGGPSWGYLVSERDTIGVRGGAAYVHYTTDRLDDYLTYFAGPFWARRLTEQTGVELSGDYRRYDRQTGLDLTQDVASGRVQLTHAFTPTFDGWVYGGGFYVRTKQDVPVGLTTVSTSDSTAGVIGGIGVTYRTERTRLTGSFDRSVSPSGAGRLLERNRLSGQIDYDMTPTIVFTFNTTYIDQAAADDETRFDRNFLSVSPGIRWHFLPEWNLAAAYRFRTQELEDTGDRAYSNGVIASVTWQLPVVQPGGRR